MNDLLKALTDINYIEGVKQSFEDEGAVLEDVAFMRYLTSFTDLYMNVKIGGCEAKTDIRNCINLDVDGIVAPMVETPFALQKFIESTSNIKTKRYINIETKSAVNNIESILHSPASKSLKGIIIGRSDLARSYGKTKSEVDSKVIYNAVEEVCKVAKPLGLKVGMGGNVTAKSAHFISNLYYGYGIDYIETRNIIYTVNSESIKELPELIKLGLVFEKVWMKYKTNKYSKLVEEYSTRYETIKNRLEF